MKGYQINDKYTVQHNKVFETFSKVKAIWRKTYRLPSFLSNAITTLLQEALRTLTKIRRAILSTTCYTSVLHYINFIYIYIYI
jgi:hypothetical protein